MYHFKFLLTVAVIVSTFSIQAQVSQLSDTTKTNLKEFSAVENEASYPGAEAAWKNI